MTTMTNESSGIVQFTVDSSKGDNDYDSINLSSSRNSFPARASESTAMVSPRHSFWQRAKHVSPTKTNSDENDANIDTDYLSTTAGSDGFLTSAQFSAAAPYLELSNFQVSMHLLKGSVGTGVLAMPAAIRDSGLVFGTLSIVIVSIIITHSMHLLLESAQYLRNLHSIRRAAAAERIRQQRAIGSLAYSTSQATLESDTVNMVTTNDESSMLAPEEVRLDYFETVRMTFLKATPPLRRWAWLAGVLNVCLIVAQMGFLSVYLVFVAENSKRIVDYYEIPDAPRLWVYFLIVFAFIVPMVFVKTLDKLAFLSGLANVLGIGGLFLVIVYCLLDLKPVTEQPMIRSMQTLPLAFGVIVFAYESINVILPVENQMRHKRDMVGLFGILSVNMTIVTAIYLAVGFFGYLRFGQEVNGAITYDIPMTPLVFALSKPMYTISIFISFTLQFYVLFSVLWELILPHLLRSTSVTSRMIFLGDGALRLFIVTFALVVSMTVPYIDLLISFMGAFAGAAIVLIFPPLVHSINTWMQLGNTWTCWFIIVKNIFVIVFGIVGAIIGGAVSLNAIIVKINENVPAT